MQGKNSLNANLVLQKIKKALNISTDIQLSEFLNIKPNTISTWKKRNSLDYASIIAISELYEIDLNELFFSTENTKKQCGSYTLETPLVSREVQFQYCIGGAGIIESLPKYSFPFIRTENTRAFQVLSSNMSPIIEENSFVVCEAAELGQIPEGSLVVIVSKAKGLFINSLAKGEKSATYILGSENTFFNPIVIKAAEIGEIWLIKGILSYNINADVSKQSHLKKSLKSLPGT